MKNLVLASMLLISSNVFASDLRAIHTLTNKALNKAALNLIANKELVNLSAFKKVDELKAAGNSAQELREKTIEQAAHTLCGFFNDGVSVSLRTKDEKGSARATDDLLDSSTGDFEANTKFVLKEVTAANKEAGVEVYSGSTSGNNTAGTVLGFYDVKNNELAVFASTNCGSDN